MDLSELSSTPSNTQQQSVLVNAQGSPLKVNLQAVELEGRPKLVRLLKSAGALVVSNAKEAAIILVDSTTESGKRLIRTWGHDASKVVLEHIWARASVNAGRPLLEIDNWGGAMTVDDGKPVTIDGVVVDEDELDEVEALVTKSPLPTPRVTPVDPTYNGPENTTTDHSVVTGLGSNTSGPPPPGSVKAQPAAVAETTISEEPMAISGDNAKPPQSPPPPPAAQPLPYSQPTLFAQPPQAQSTYGYAPYGTQQAYPPPQSQMIPTQPFLHPSFSHSQPQLAHAPSVPHTSLPSTQSPMTPMASNTASINGLNLQAAITTIMEVVRHMDHPSLFAQNQLLVSQPPANANTPTFAMQPPAAAGPAPSNFTPQVTRRVRSPGVDASLSGSQGHLSDAASSSQKYRSVTEVYEDRLVTRKSRAKLARRLPDEAMTLSIPRKRPPVVKSTNPPKRLRKGKEKAILTDSSEHSEVDELMDASDGLGSYSTRSSTSPSVRRQNIVERKKHGEIFLSGSGHPLRFFVQVDLHGRHTVVTNIKKNRGKIVNNIADADYLILFARSDTFQGLLNEATALGKFPILAAFVADCIEEGALLDETDYILESAAKLRSLKRSHQNASFLKVETPEPSSRQTKVARHGSSPTTEKIQKPKGTPLKPLAGKKMKEPKSAPVQPTAAEEGEDSTASRPPTPPPATTRQMLKSGKYLFTKVEDEYFLCLARHYLTRDPTISNTGLVHKLHEQLPHHTLASWAAHIDKKMKGTVEDIRKRANIAKRKRNEAANRSLPQGPANEAGSSEVHAAEGNSHIPLSPSQPSQEDLERQDFDVITHFFASGGGDDDDDERVWQGLEKHQPCRSASSWPEYYAAHEKQVYARIEELMNERAGD